MPQGGKGRVVELIALLGFVVCLLTGCQTPRVKTIPGTVGLATRNNCYSLLQQELEQQKDVSMLRFIKKEHSDLKNLIKQIASASAAGSKMLEEFAKQDSTLVLDDYRLPHGEVATRAAISVTDRNQLLSRKGNEFELTLLLTQTDALSYAWHLAEIAGQNEPHPEHARAMADLSEEMKNLSDAVFRMLLSREK